MWPYIIGHLFGDFIIQSDWEANNKTWKQRKWFGLLVAMWHAFYIAALIFMLSYFSGNMIEPWKILVVWITHALQDWTRFPFKIMELRGQFGGIKFNKWIVSGNNCLFMHDVHDLLHEKSPNKKSNPESIRFPEHAYLWACFVVDQVWHFATYYILFII